MKRSIITLHLMVCPLWLNAGLGLFLNNTQAHIAALFAPTNALTLSRALHEYAPLIPILGRERIERTFHNIAGNQRYILAEDVPLFNLALALNPPIMCIAGITTLAASIATYFFIKGIIKGVFKGTSLLGKGIIKTGNSCIKLNYCFLQKIGLLKPNKPL